MRALAITVAAVGVAGFVVFEVLHEKGVRGPEGWPLPLRVVGQFVCVLVLLAAVILAALDHYRNPPRPRSRQTSTEAASSARFTNH